MIGTKAPRLKVQPGTGLGAALRLLDDCIKREVRVHSAHTKGDYKPLIFLLTDGDPTDDWRADAQKLKAPSKTGGKKMNIIGIGCGEDANPLVLNEICDSVLMMGESELDFRNLFQWISSSLSVTSQNIGAPNASAVSLAKIPAETFSAPSIPIGATLEQPRRPTWLFLSLRCCQTRAPFLNALWFRHRLRRLRRRQNSRRGRRLLYWAAPRRRRADGHFERTGLGNFALPALRQPRGGPVPELSEFVLRA